MTTSIEIKPIDEAKLEAFIKSGDFKGAKKLIGAFLDQELSPEEKGHIYTQIISTYLSISNKMNASYLQQLNDSLAALKKFNVLNKKNDDKLRVDEIQEKLRAPEEPEYEDDGL